MADPEFSQQALLMFPTASPHWTWSASASDYLGTAGFSEALHAEGTIFPKRFKRSKATKMSLKISFRSEAKHSKPDPRAEHLVHLAPDVAGLLDMRGDTLNAIYWIKNVGWSPCGFNRSRITESVFEIHYCWRPRKHGAWIDTVVWFSSVGALAKSDYDDWLARKDFQRYLKSSR